MKKQLQLSINLPFAYYTELDSATGAPLFRYPSPGMIRQYADALCAEMDLWKDCSEVEISSIRPFSSRSVTAYWYWSASFTSVTSHHQYCSR